MKVNIYYGGRGVMDDPTMYVLTKFEEVLDELRVKVSRYNLFEQKNSISTLPQTIKDADAVVFATTVEWLGLGGFMYQFLDACWLYGDKEKISTTYMQPIVMSTTYGEKEAIVTLENAWETLGGLPCSGICGYVDDMLAFEASEEYTEIIGKAAENLYRTVSHKQKSLPNSNQAITRTVAHTAKLELTPQESETLSEYVSDDEYVTRQKEDIRELTERFRNMIGTESPSEDDDSVYIKDFETHFIKANSRERLEYSFMIDGKKKPLSVISKDGVLKIGYESATEAVDATIKIKDTVMENILDGRMTFNRAFMTGELSAKGNFKVIRTLDELFNFEETNQ